MRMSKKILESALWGEKPEITQAVIEYYKDNPQELDLISDEDYFHGKFIQFIFIIGIAITVISRILTFFFEGTWAAFINDVVLDVFSELGIAIFGGAITAYILEKLKTKRYQDHLRFKDEVIKKIKDN